VSAGTAAVSVGCGGPPAPGRSAYCHGNGPCRQVADRCGVGAPPCQRPVAVGKPLPAGRRGGVSGRARLAVQCRLWTKAPQRAD
jgi:hypothetical protein